MFFNILYKNTPPARSMPIRNINCNILKKSKPINTIELPDVAVGLKELIMTTSKSILE